MYAPNRKHVDQRNSFVFAFGSSTPRMLDAVDERRTYWLSRRTMSVSNVFSSPSTSTSSYSNGPSSRQQDKQNRMSASFTTFYESPDAVSSGMYCSVNRRKTDLTPVTPPIFRSSVSVSPKRDTTPATTPSTASKTMSMSRLDQLALPKSYSNYRCNSSANCNFHKRISKSTVNVSSSKPKCSSQNARNTSLKSNSSMDFSQKSRSKTPDKPPSSDLSDMAAKMTISVERKIKLRRPPSAPAVLPKTRVEHKEKAGGGVRPCSPHWKKYEDRAEQRRSVFSFPQEVGISINGENDANASAVVKPKRKKKNETTADVKADAAAIPEDNKDSLGAENQNATAAAIPPSDEDRSLANDISDLAECDRMMMIAFTPCERPVNEGENRVGDAEMNGKSDVAEENLQREQQIEERRQQMEVVVEEQQEANQEQEELVSEVERKQKLKKEEEEQQQQQQEEEEGKNKNEKRDEEQEVKPQTVKSQPRRTTIEEVERYKEELDEKIRKEDEERRERRKRVEAIMSRTRNRISGTDFTPQPLKEVQ